MNNLRKVLYKTLIEVAEVDEELHLMRFVEVDHSTTACTFLKFIFSSSMNSNSFRKKIF